MATWVDIDLPSIPREEGDELLAAIETELRRFDRDYYAWGDGELAALNRALTDAGRFEASVELAALVESASTIAELTAYAFDPGVGGLVELWGFHVGDPPIEPPDTGAITSARREFASIAALTVDGATIRASPRAVVLEDGRAAPARRFKLDLGGIAKGAAVDRVFDLLELDAVEPALINAGGDLRVVGERADRPWRIGIAAPRADGVLGVIELEAGEAAFTSGDYERFYEADGERLHHILDPRTGYPVMHTQAITVIASNGTLADAAATALFVAGPDDWQAMADALGIRHVLRVDASGSVEMTGPMRDRFRPAGEADLDIIAASD